MRQASYNRTGPARDVFRIDEVERPSPGAGEVLVRVHASGINPSDFKQRAGWAGTKPPVRPIVPHSDGAGVVAALGAGVDPSWQDRRVWIWNARGGSFYGVSNGPEVGTASEYIALPLRQVVPLPDNVDFDIGAALGGPACTAYYVLFADGDVKGSSILVQGGAGAVGELVIQFAKAAGARVFASVSSSAKAAVAKAAGADHVINYRNENVIEAVRSLCPEGLDRIAEVDFAANIHTDIALMRQNGTIASYSSPSKSDPVLPYYALQFKGLTVRFIQGYSVPSAIQERGLKHITAGLAAGWLKPTIAARYPLEDIAAAHDFLESGRAIGKVVVQI
jgi:NADPH2:quinone reductase